MGFDIIGKSGLVPGSMGIIRGSSPIIYKGDGTRNPEISDLLLLSLVITYVEGGRSASL